MWNRLRGSAVAKTNKNLCYILRVRKAAFPTKTLSSTNIESLKCTKLHENNFTFWTTSDKSGQEAEENFETLQWLKWQEDGEKLHDEETLLILQIISFYFI